MKKGQMELFDNAMDVHPDRSGFPKHFDALVDALGGVAKLRGMILELAIRGRLVPQDPHVEPAIAFLKRIAAERKNFSGAGRGRAPKLPEEELTCEPSFDPPPGWTWVRIGEIFDVVGGLQKTPKRAPVDNHYPYLRVENVQRGRLDLSRIERFELLQGELDRLRLMVGDLLVVEGNGSETEIGRCARWEGAIEDCVHQNHLIRCRPIAPLKSDFALLFLNSPSGIAQMKKLAITTSGLFSLSVGKIRGIATPMPPLAEQERIVAKVDQLMALCDELEARQTRKRDTGDRLTKAALGALTSAESAEELQLAWKRVEQNLGELFEQTEKVAALRSTILDLAVSGGLSSKSDAFVELVSSPESVDLLARRVPHGWACVPLGSVAESRLGKMLDAIKNRGVPLPYLRNTNVHWFRFELSSIKEMLFEPGEISEYELRDGDLLVCEGGHGIGRCAVWAGQMETMMFQKALHRIRPNRDLNPHFLAFQIKAASDSGMLSKLFTGSGIPHLTGRTLARFPVVMPQRSEQDRIVARVEQLLALCDDLEAKLRARDEKAAKLAAAIVAEAIA